MPIGPKRAKPRSAVNILYARVIESIEFALLKPDEPWLSLFETLKKHETRWVMVDGCRNFIRKALGPGAMREIAPEMLGDTHILNGDFDDAVKAHQQMIQKFPQRMSLRIALGHSYMVRGAVREYNAAMGDEAAKKFLPWLPSYKPKDDYLKAFEAYKTALTQDPTNGPLTRYIGRAYCALGNYDKALTIGENPSRGVASQKDFAKIQDEAIKVSAKQSSYWQAIAQLALEWGMVADVEKRQIAEICDQGHCFGVPLEEIVRRENRSVPFIIDWCMTAFSRFDVGTEGIYRRGGNSQMVGMLRELFDDSKLRSQLLSFRN
jgi:tetratricopeptide (TPR) repeat protein